MILAGRNPERLQRAASELGALRTAAFDATDFAQLETFFEELRAPIDHVMVTGPGPYYALLAGLDLEKARHDVDGLAAATTVSWFSRRSECARRDLFCSRKLRPRRYRMDDIGGHHHRDFVGKVSLRPWGCDEANRKLEKELQKNSTA